MGVNYRVEKRMQRTRRLIWIKQHSGVFTGGCPQETENSLRVETTHTVVRGVLSEVAVAGGKGCEHLEDEVAESFCMV